MLYLKAVGLFLKGVPRWAWIALAAALVLWKLVGLHNEAERAAYQAAYNHGVADTRQLYVDAQAEADRLATQGVQVTTGKQAAISKESSDALETDNRSIDARADAIRVHHEAAQAAPRRAPQPVDLPATREGAGQPCPTPTEDGLPWSVAFPLMLQAEKNQAQLNKLIDFELKQDALAAEGEAVANPTPK